MDKFSNVTPQLQQSPQNLDNNCVYLIKPNDINNQILYDSNTIFTLNNQVQYQNSSIVNPISISPVVVENTNPNKYVFLLQTFPNTSHSVGNYGIDQILQQPATIVSLPNSNIASSSIVETLSVPSKITENDNPNIILQVNDNILTQGAYQNINHENDGNEIIKTSIAESHPQPLDNIISTNEYLENNYVAEEIVESICEHDVKPMDVNVTQKDAYKISTVSNEKKVIEDENVKLEHISISENENSSDTLVQKPIKYTSKKKRRRIVMPENESDPDDNAQDRDELLHSPDINNLSDIEQIPIVLDPSEYNENEMPKPKSKKNVTKRIKEKQARALLESAVFIPAINSKKKKKIRCLDSDDEDEGNNDKPVVDTLEDIGMESIETPDIKNIILIKEEIDTTNFTVCESKTLSFIKSEPEELQEIYANPINYVNNDTMGTKIKTEKSILKGIQKVPNQMNQDPRKKVTWFDVGSSSSDEEYIPNDLYFGTPDSYVVSDKVKPRRGRPPRQTSLTEYNSRVSTGKIKRKSIKSEPISSSESDFTGTESDSSLENYKERQRRKGIAKNNTKFNNRVVEPPKTEISYSFKDPSHNIPNDIYFNAQVPLHVLYSYNSTTSSESEEDPLEKYNINLNNGRNRGRPKTNNLKKRNNKKIEATNLKQTNTFLASNVPVNTENTSILEKMKYFLKLAGLLRETNLKNLWKGSRSHKEKVDKVLELLHNKGLEGDPTVTKCKDLKKRLQTEKESKELDTTAIIETEGRARRSSTRTLRRSVNYYEDEEAQVTLSKIKKLVDSDSDYEKEII